MRPTDIPRVAWVPACAALLAACHAPMSALGPAGPGAARITGLTWGLMAAAALVASVVGVLFLGAIRRNGAGDSTVDLTPRGNRFVTVGGVMLPAAVLLAVFLVGLGVLHRMSTTTSLPEVTFELTGHQWWWDVEYLDPVIARRFHAANEIHVPVGRVVHLRLVSADVIHSFWVPSLQGKLDLVPGDTNDMRFVASEPGSWRGQCAEYCGAQHAHMAFTIVAEDDASFQHWLADQQAPAIQSSDSLSTIGRGLVVTGPCALCHTVRGTMARGQVAPDLTHVGSRTTLAAGLLPNQLGTMEAWVANPQSLKPGVRMPTMTQFSGVELRAIAAYLEGLR